MQLIIIVGGKHILSTIAHLDLKVKGRKIDGGQLKINCRLLFKV